MKVIDSTPRAGDTQDDIGGLAVEEGMVKMRLEVLGRRRRIIHTTTAPGGLGRKGKRAKNDISG